MTIGIQADNNRDANRRARGTALVTDYRKPVLTIQERFWKNVEKTTPEGCWLWKGHFGPSGYGHFGFEGRPHPAHRIAWLFTYGDLAEGLYVCHNCPDGDNRACVNPAHLWLGTAADNMRDCIAKGRRYYSPQTFTDAECHEIYALYQQSNVFQYQLAERFGVSQSSIWRAMQRAKALMKEP